MNCIHCGKECKSANSLRNHERTCPGNPNRIYKNGMAGKTPWNKGLTKDDDRVAKYAATLSVVKTGKPSKTVWTEEMRKAKSEWRKQLHRDHPEMHPNRKLAGNRNRMSYPERVAFDYLTRMGIEFEHQKQVDKYFPDFIVGKVIVEVDGERWHDAEKDKQRDAVLESYGYSVIRIKATDNIESRLEEIFRA